MVHTYISNCSLFAGMHVPVWTKRLSVLCLAWVVLLTAARSCPGQHVRVGIGDLNRGVPGRWTLLRATVTNKSDSDTESLVIVTPVGGDGTQFAARIIAPANASRSFQWPVRVPLQHSRSLDFDYVVLNGSEESGVVERRIGEDVIRSFSVLNPKNPSGQPPGLCAWITTATESPEHARNIERLAELCRNETGQSSAVLALTPDVFDGYSEALDPFDQVVISTQELLDYPEACDAVSQWIQRGGRCWIMADQTGLEVVSALLGDTLPLSHVDSTTTNSITMRGERVNAQGKLQTEEVSRSFDEPVTLVRVLANDDSVVWDCNGWPAVITKGFGRGQVAVTLVSAEVFMEHTPGDSDDIFDRTSETATKLVDQIFRGLPGSPPVEQPVLTDSANQQVGYRIISRSSASALLAGFSVVLVAAGLTFTKRFGAESLAWTVPLLAIVASIPAVLMGKSDRDVAPPTLISHSIVQLEANQTRMVRDGVATIYQPEPGSVSFVCSDRTQIDHVISGTSSARRFVWDDVDHNKWLVTDQAAGVQHLTIRSVLSLPRPTKAEITFDSLGITGIFHGADSFNAEDAIIAGLSPDLLYAEIDSGQITSSAGDILAPGVFSRDAVLSDDQLRRSPVYASLFQYQIDGEAFPQQPCLLFWSDQDYLAPLEADADFIQSHSTLFIQPLTMRPPATDDKIVIPPTFLPYQAVRDATGGVSAAYSNSQRTWQERQQAGTTLLAFDIPDVCQPFAFDDLTVTLRIRAGSRMVKVSGGQKTQLQPLDQFDSPVGQFDISFPSSVTADLEGEKQVFLQIEVGDTANVDKDVIQEKFWKIDRVMMTARGHRTAE